MTICSQRAPQLSSTNQYYVSTGVTPKRLFPFLTDIDLYAMRSCRIQRQCCRALFRLENSYTNVVGVLGTNAWHRSGGSTLSGQKCPLDSQQLAKRYIYSAADRNIYRV